MFFVVVCWNSWPGQMIRDICVDWIRFLGDRIRDPAVATQGPDGKIQIFVNQIKIMRVRIHVFLGRIRLPIDRIKILRM